MNGAGSIRSAQDQPATDAGVRSAVNNSETTMNVSPVHKRVLCLGETMAQVVPSDRLPLAEACTFWIGHAGAESNVAVSLARLGTPASWAGILGDDPLGARVRREIDDFGVDTSLVRFESGGRTGVFFKDPGEGGSAVYYYRAGSAAAGMDSNFAAQMVASRPRWIHLTGVTCALSPSCSDAVTTALGDARATGIPVSFDVNYRRALWTDATQAGRDILAAARLADVVFVGLDEAEVLWGSRTAHEVRELINTAAVLIVKDGAIECTAFQDGSAVIVPALPVQVVEPVGAGDAFAAGWLHGHLAGLDAASCLRLGHLMAGIALISESDFGSIEGDPQSLVNRAVAGTDWSVRTPQKEQQTHIQSLQRSHNAPVSHS